jgi:hypothetical protein
MTHILRHAVGIVRDRVKGIYYREFHKYGHFCFEDMHTEETPSIVCGAKRRK